MKAIGRQARQLIVNGDDFGLNSQVNEGIILAGTEGVLTSCSWLANGSAAEEAARLARECPRLEVGVHLTLVQGRPLLPAETVGSLARGPAGEFPPSFHRVLPALLRGGIDLGEVRREWAAQIEKALALGLRPTHLDSHQHLHIWPTLLPLAIDLAKEYGLPALRVPDEPWWIWRPWAGPARLLARNALSVLATRARRAVRRHGLWCPDHFRGMLAGGRLRRIELAGIIESLPLGVTEIMCHPAIAGPETAALGWGYEWESELAALTEPGLRRRLAQEGVILRGFAG